MKRNDMVCPLLAQRGTTRQDVLEREIAGYKRGIAERAKEMDRLHASAFAIGESMKADQRKLKQALGELDVIKNAKFEAKAVKGRKV